MNGATDGICQFNLARVFETVADAVPERECIVFGDRRLTYSQVLDRAHRLAGYLHRRGLGIRQERQRESLAGHQSGQDHVGLYLYNGNEYLESMIGAYRARVAPFNVNYRYVSEELAYLLRDARTSGVIYHGALAPTLSEVLPDLDEVAVLLQVDDGSGNDLLPGAVDYEDALASMPAEPPDVEPHPDDLYVLYTGGTTGMPKGVLWRQHDIFMAAMGGRSLGTWEPMESYADIATKAAAGPGLRSMPLPPLMHGAAQWVSYIGMTNGGTIVMPAHTVRMDPAEVWRTIAEEKVHIVAVVGDAMARPLIEELESGDYDTSSLMAFGNGGAPLNPALKERIIAKIPHVLVSDSVGSSETGAQGSHISVKGSVQTGSFQPGPGAVVVDEEMTRVLPPGHEGIGWFAQTGWVPLGYLGDPDKTARTFPVIDGTRFSVPGDRAVHAECGAIEVLGRDSVTINSGGEKIFAEEVEKAIAGHPGVADVVVCGRDSDRWGQEVVALVKLGHSDAASAEELVEHASQFIARYKLPKEIIFLNEIVRSPAGKADYRWARAIAAGGNDESAAGGTR